MDNTWQVTAELRWFEETKFVSGIVGWRERTLQQKWLSNTGEEKWQDVPTVKDEK